MPLTLDAELLRPYLDALRTSRAARLAYVNAMNARRMPHITQQAAALQCTYHAAVSAHTEACVLLARHVDEVVEG